MTYDKPEIRDFGSIADHTYDQHEQVYKCVSGPNLLVDCDDQG
jgi:hypothetical protein